MLLRFTLLIFLVSIWNLITQAQSAILLNGKVIDEKHQPVNSATIIDMSSSHGTFSDQQGNFSMAISHQPATLHITHVGFKDKVYILTKADLEHIANNSLFIEIILQSSPVEISPVEVFGNKQVRAYNKPWIPVIDFEFLGSNLLLIAFENKKYDVRLVNNDDSVLLQTPLSFVPESFFKDCLDQFHVLSADSNYRVTVVAGAIKIFASSNLNDFNRVVFPCAAATNQSCYFRKFGAYNQSEFYVDSKRNSDEEKLFAEIHDSIGEQLAEEELERIFGLSAYANTQMAEIFSAADLKLSRKYVHDLWFYQKIRTIPIYNPLMKIRDSLYLFNHAKGRLNVFDENGKSFRSMPLIYHKDKNWNKQIVVDEANGDVFMSFISNGYVTLKKFDLSSGNFVAETQLNRALFPESIKIRNGIAYYLLQHSEEYTGYNLFMQHLN